MNWTSRKQWTCRVGTPSACVLITITREEGSNSWTWWLDPSDGYARPAYCSSPAISLTEAKRRSVADAEAFLVRLVAARGGG